MIPRAGQTSRSRALEARVLRRQAEARDQKAASSTGGGGQDTQEDGPGVSQSDLLVINKIDLAPYVNASLQVMETDSRLVRGDKPFIFTNCVAGDGMPAVVGAIRHDVLFDVEPAGQPRFRAG